MRTGRRRPPLLALAPVLAVLSLLAWVFASPIGAGPDDDYHLMSAWCAGPVADETCAPAASGGADHRIPVELVEISCFAGDAKQSGACQDRYFDGDLLDDLAVSDRANFTGEYPPVYYAVMGLFTSHDVQASALVMRVFTVLLFVGMLTALYVLLPVTRRPTLLLGWLVTAVPLGVFLLASNNPSAWAAIGVGTSWIALLGYFETGGGRRIALGALYALGVIMAAGSRGDAAVYVGFATVLVLLYTFRLRREYLLAAVVPVVMGLVALAFLLSSRQIGSGVGGFSEEPINIGGADRPALEELSGIGRLAYNIVNAPLIWAGAFGEWGLGWLDTGTPAIVTFGALGAFAAAAFLGIRDMDVRKAILIGLIGLVLWALPVYVLQQGGNIVGENLQPRYLLPLIVLLGGVLALGTPVMRWTRGQLLVVAGAVSVAHLVALHFNLRRYITGVVGGGFNLDKDYEWWWNVPFTPMVVWAIGSLAFIGLAVVIALRMPVARARIADAQAVARLP